jgi:hypothetical protein
MRRTLAPSCLLLVVLGLGAGATCTSGDAESRQEAAEHAEEHQEEHAELALHMVRLQRWTQKTALALQARNPDLADFYLHEMEESMETIQTEAPTYEGYAIADRTEEILVPRVEALDGALDERNWEAVDERLAQLARACNQCHQVTDHGFVKIDLEDVPNPYPQDFSSGGK